MFFSLTSPRDRGSNAQITPSSLLALFIGLVLEVFAPAAPRHGLRAHRFDREHGCFIRSAWRDRRTDAAHASAAGAATCPLTRLDRGGVRPTGGLGRADRPS